jgi:transcription-repair coupling factor (superfamily II helicase)
MTELTQLLAAGPAYRSLERALVPPGARAAASNLVGSSKSLLVAALAERGIRGGAPWKTILVVTPGTEATDAFAEDLRAFLGEGAAAVFPAWEVLPYEDREPHPDIVGERLEFLARLARGELVVGVAPARALAELVVGPQDLGGLVLVLRVGDRWDRERLLRRIVELGFEREAMVSGVGEFSARGGILDLYGFGMAAPVRLEFDGNEIATMRTFDLTSQRSIQPLREVAVLPAREPGARRAGAGDGRPDPDGGRQRARGNGAPPGGTGVASAESAAPAPAEGNGLVVARAPLVSPVSYLPAAALVVLDEPEHVERTWQEHWDEVLRRHADAAATDDGAGPPPPPESRYGSPRELTRQLRSRRTLALHALHMQQGPLREGRASPAAQPEDGATAGAPQPEDGAAAGAPQPDGGPAAAPRTQDGGPGAAAPSDDLPEVRTVRFSTREPETIARDVRRLREVVADHHAAGHRVVIWCDNLGQLERLEELLAADAALARLDVGNVAAGFRLPEERIAVYTDHEIFERQRRIPRRVRYRVAAPLESFTDIHPGDYLVHIDYGIGRFLGIERLALEGGTVETLALQYAEGDKLYVPVDRLNLVEKYTSEDGAEPALHRLGTPRWERQKARTRKAIEDMTEELLELYAQREVDRGFAFSADTPWQRALEASFLWEDTPDQAKATGAVKRDMESRRPMDRLLSGDVGYGKTEVAIRAAFKAVQDAKQVAILVPTTVLAAQHLETFRERLADFPVRIEALSRFESRKEQAAVLQGLAAGDVDIVIGTHRLLSPDVKYRDLGLVVIDEEQRFGVKHKERLRKIRAAVDVLAMTATPIPRTLYFSLAGIREMSLLETPPADRIPVLTVVSTFDEDLIRDAIRRELDRGGQVFFIHNRIETIDEVAEVVRRLVPEARVEVAHGKMADADLEPLMLRFFHGDLDVLVSTTIVESGLDVPRANTLLVNRADRMGLAELYQLRGRVGRSHRRAYAYFLVPPRGRMTEDAEKRLRVIEEFSELGAGHAIALKDLEIRGAGNLLGREQSGFIQSVGLETYLKLLDETVRRLKGQRPEERPETEVAFEGPAYLPDAYIPDARLKLNLYRRASRLDEPSAVDELREELADRYGPPPPEAENLLASLELRLRGTRAGLRRIRVAPRLPAVELEWPQGVVPPLGAFEGLPLPEATRVEVLGQSPTRLRLRAPAPGAAIAAAIHVLAAASGDAVPAARPAAAPALVP